MSLLESAYEPFIFINKTFVPDGEGAGHFSWTEGDEFMATADFATSSLARIADKLTENVSCTITTPKSMILEPMDVIKRKEDGQLFRITSDGKNKKTPASAALNMRQSTAILWELPTGAQIAPKPSETTEG